MNKIRLVYEKNDEVKYLGHLDTITMFDRTFRRADIKISFSQGFNPKPNIVFALPSGAGLISKCEILEIELDDKIDEEIIVQKLNSTLPLGFKVISAKYVIDNKSLMAKVRKSEYEIYMKFENVKKDELEKKIIELFNLDIITVNKKVKIDKPKEEIDIKPFIEHISVEKYVDNDWDIVIRMKAKAGSKENLRPNYILQAIENLKLSIYDYQIVRTNLILEE